MAVAQICAALPPDFPATILLAQHLARHQPSAFVELLSRHTPLHVCWGTEGAVLQPHTIVVAPPDHHMVVNAEGAVTLLATPPIQFTQPSGDALFASVALRFRARALGVVLTGTGKDGALGAIMLKHLGGRVLVQDATSAAHFGMPSAAIDTGCVDFILRLDAMARTLMALVMAPAAAALFQVGTAFSQTHKYNALARRWRH